MSVSKSAKSVQKNNFSRQMSLYKRSRETPNVKKAALRGDCAVNLHRPRGSVYGKHGSLFPMQSYKQKLVINQLVPLFPLIPIARQVRCKIREKAKVVSTLATNEAQQIACPSLQIRGNRGQVGLIQLYLLTLNWR